MAGPCGFGLGPAPTPPPGCLPASVRGPGLQCPEGRGLSPQSSCFLTILWAVVVIPLRLLTFINLRWYRFRLCKSCCFSFRWQASVVGPDPRWVVPFSVRGAGSSGRDGTCLWTSQPHKGSECPAGTLGGPWQFFLKQLPGQASRGRSEGRQGRLVLQVQRPLFLPGQRPSR